MFPAQRSREQFERFFVPAFTVILFLLQAGGAWFLWRWLSQSHDGRPRSSSPSPGWRLFGVFALVLFLLGRFSATIARLEHQRLLRPGASYLLLNAFLVPGGGAGPGRCLGRLPEGGLCRRACPCAACWAWSRSRP